MIGLAYFLIIWIVGGLLTGIKYLFVDQMYDDEFKQLMIQETSPGMERNMVELFFRNKANIMTFHILIGFLPLIIKIVGLLKRG
ncbi:hypothetical protein P8917_09240 [Bacillus atrophaeus]|uniref:hypothetical protein n=1 Tax=Bacillus atrophaeus TaxID=1452 RepID=UPI00227F74D7|nr:hypothetical protein [Bacillus atrophaeus]MCY8499678.1 hypothetical protein [Bacillus atrophaeus]MCY8815024.1 hypothetical protein [Bacillus atrophaeus]MCY8823074.1 hypothetical protein [Bacillus atrophaeus]MCY8831299.1 hypothetical protein [Bacillus atrophaeus]MCY8834905.1 hypothetical protein [Bacillus atrophaeus]